jgi:hypothetical protein
MDYKRIYYKICNRAKDEYQNGVREKFKRNFSGYTYYEGHHVIPVCLGGGGRSDNWLHNNIVPLTAREHFIAHWLLHLIYPNNLNLKRAFSSMCRLKDKNQSRYVPSSRVIEYAKQLFIESISGDNSHMKKTEYSGVNHPMKNPKIAMKGANKRRGKYVGKNSPSYGKIGWSAGKKRPEISKRMKGDNNPAAKAVIQYDINGNFIKEYKTAKEAATKLNIARSGICVVCSGKPRIKNGKQIIRKTCGGFIWKYK